MLDENRREKNFDLLHLFAVVSAINSSGVLTGSVRRLL